MLREKFYSFVGDRATRDSPHSDAPSAKKNSTDKNNSFDGNVDKILDENNDTSEMQENKRVDADVSVSFFSA